MVSTVRSNPPMAADELRRQADTFIELQDLEAEISREHGSRDQPPAKDMSPEEGDPPAFIENA